MRKKRSNIYLIIIEVLSFFLIFTSLWIISYFGEVTLDEIIFNLKVTQKGVDTGFVYDYVYNALILIIVSSCLYYFIIIKQYKLKVEMELMLKKRRFKGVIFPLNNMLKTTLVLVLFLYSVIHTFNLLSINSYIKGQLSKSKLIEKEYIESKNTKITFENEKRNLIYIFLESMEASYTSKENGGTKDYDLIPELSNLAKENISFSNTEKLGGALSVTGTTWTVGALVSHTSGLPLLLKIDGNSYGKNESFVDGAYTLGEILKDNGYNQEIMFGSDASYAARDIYFKKHGNYKIWDLNTAIQTKKMKKSDQVWWGIEDKNLIEFAKEEITKLSKKEAPFNFTILTADTHFEDGYLSEYCDAKYNDQYSSVISCSSKMIYEFVEWIKTQDFYNNTTIVITGDHLTMDTDFYEGLNDNYERTIYNVFINSKITTENIKNRIFTTMDMFPTTLAAMGATIDGDKLGIGTNLFSQEKTIAEKYGINFFREELQKNSTFYNDKFIYNKR